MDVNISCLAQVPLSESPKSESIYPSRSSPSPSVRVPLSETPKSGPSFSFRVAQVRVAQVSPKPESVDRWTPTPVLYSATTHPFLGYVRTQNTPNPTPKHPSSWPELESGQNELPSGQPGLQLGKMFEKWTKLFWKWQKEIIHIFLPFFAFLRQYGDVHLDSQTFSIKTKDTCALLQCNERRQRLQVQLCKGFIFQAAGGNSGRQSSRRWQKCNGDESKLNCVVVSELPSEHTDSTLCGLRRIRPVNGQAIPFKPFKSGSSKSVRDCAWSGLRRISNREAALHEPTSQNGRTYVHLNQSPASETCGSLRIRVWLMSLYQILALA